MIQEEVLKSRKLYIGMVRKRQYRELVAFVCEVEFYFLQSLATACELIQELAIECGKDPDLYLEVVKAQTHIEGEIRESIPPVRVVDEEEDE